MANYRVSGIGFHDKKRDREPGSLFFPGSPTKHPFERAGSRIIRWALNSGVPKCNQQRTLPTSPDGETRYFLGE